MFPYHNRLKQLLNNFDYTVSKESGVFAYRFYFPQLCTSKPIREHRVSEYLGYINCAERTEK
jgi:hypothetical protein